MAWPSNIPGRRCPRRSLWPATSALLVLVLAGALAGQSSPSPAPQAAPPPPLPTGQIIERVPTRSDPAKSYALYLPSAYTPKRQWPIILAFDPGARGKVPVELFREAAEKDG